MTDHLYKKGSDVDTQKHSEIQNYINQCLGYATGVSNKLLLLRLIALKVGLSNK